MDPGGEVHRKIKSWFMSSEEASREAFQKMERDQDYYDGKQLTHAEFQALASRGQPPITINLIRRKIDFLLGLEVQQRADPKAYPRTPLDADGAEVATDTLRYVGDWNEYSYTRARAWRDMLVTGVGGCMVDVAPNGRPVKPVLQQYGIDRNNPNIVIRRTPWDRMWWDAHSSEPDFSDATHRGLVIWMDAEDAKLQYPDAVGHIEASLEGGAQSETYDDRPKNAGWCDTERKRIRVVQCYWKQSGRVFWCEATGGGILAGGETPWMNTDGEPEDPYIWRSAYVDRDNNRHGVVRDMIDPQDEVNKRRSKALHLLTMRQVVMDEGAVSDVEKAKRQLARPDGVIVKTPGMEFNIAENSDLTTGQMRLLEHATAELEKMGPNAALQGVGTEDQSGRAIQAQQQGGMVELGQLLDHLRSMDRGVFSSVWARAKQFWDAPQFIRVTDRDDAPQFVGLNEPVVDPSTGMVVGTKNNVADLDIDIIIENAPDVAVLEQEVWSDLTQIIPTLAQLPPNLQQFVVEASPLPASRKRKLTEILQSGMQQDPQAMAMQQAATEQQYRKGEAEIAEKEANAVKRQADAQKAMREATAPVAIPM
jgi:hypothetical protein